MHYAIRRPTTAAKVKDEHDENGGSPDTIQCWVVFVSLILRGDMFRLTYSTAFHFGNDTKQE
jgi:hypothetical protein